MKINRKTRTVEFTSAFGEIDVTLNKWLEEHPNKQILDIKYNTVMQDIELHETALIIYLDDEEGERL